ncbi:polyadenylate-binding protein RBP45-like isoform X2 [Euphorbia lathyris]|uniref:polyadenylate-binding protein RBP45-like isoform X2 n=1 Tax=Euphorbia lathyris TaxID=212925 RepID=UPI0033134602
MMQQPGAGGMVPSQPPMGPPQQASIGQQPPQGHPQQYQQPQPYMMMMPQMPQSQPPPQAMWGHQPSMPSAMPPQQQQQQQQAQQAQQQGQGQPGSAEEIRTLWIGDLQYWMDENYLHNCFSHTGEVVSVKVIRNKQTGQVEGYGFIEFNSHGAAERVLQTYNGTAMPNGEQSFRLNWASFSGGDKRDDSPDFTIFVGDLAADVTDYQLQETFRVRFPSTKGAKVVIDRLTGRTKGYGFVRFGDESEQVRAMTEMNGAFCSTRPMRIGLATNKKAVTGGGQQYPKASYQNSQGENENDPSNTTIFVGNLDSNVTDDHLRDLFGQYGQLLHVKIPTGKRCGFVQFADRSCAEEALRVLNGAQLSGQNIRLSWGRSPSNKQTEGGQWNAAAGGGSGGGAGGGYYGYAAQGYENYGYAAAPQDPNAAAAAAYYGGYPGYGNYQQHQQQQQVGYS